MNPTEQAELRSLFADLVRMESCPLNYLDLAEAHVRKVLGRILAARAAILARQESEALEMVLASVEG